MSNRCTTPITRDIPLKYHGLRLDSALAQLFPEYSRAQLTHWFKGGRLQIKPPFHKPKDKVRGGEQVTLTAQALNTDLTDPEAEAIPLTIVYEDEHCLVINKPAGLVVHPGAGNPRHTLVNALLHHAPHQVHLPRAGLIHRLDKDTTGLLLVAKTETAYTHLVRQMQAREVTREYKALVYGHVITGGRIETGFGRDKQQRLKMAVLPAGRIAITLYSVEKHFTGTTLLSVKLMTGRTHQIRVHLTHIKYPIVGDPLYGGRGHMPRGLDAEQRQVLTQFNRQALHACLLQFNHPVSEERLTFTAPIPDDFLFLLKALHEKYA